MRNIFPQVENQAKQNFSQSKEYQKIKENTTEESSDTVSVLSDIAVNFEKMSKNFTEQNNLLKENLLSMKTELQDIKEKFNNDFFTTNKSNEVEVEVHKKKIRRIRNPWWKIVEMKLLYMVKAALLY